ncbi:MAG: sulfite exporter TauE/SafE family protein [Oscillospiraceae bacterium]|nr:sulfite exporter TauE/SafE family protein [Oscillospiraceae bacterium]
MQFFLDVLAGAATGVITGFGIGGGTLLILYLTFFRGTEQLAAQGINLIYFLPSAVCALISHIKNRRVIWRAVVFCAVPGVAVSIAAALFAAQLDMGVLRRIFGGFLIIVGISELFAKKK